MLEDSTTHKHTQPAPPHLLDTLVHSLLEDPGHQQRDAGHQQEQGQRPRSVEAASAHSVRRSRAGPGRTRPGSHCKEGGAAAKALEDPGPFGAAPSRRPVRARSWRARPRVHWADGATEGRARPRFQFPSPCGRGASLAQLRRVQGARRDVTFAGRVRRNPGRRPPATARGGGRGRRPQSCALRRLQ